MSFIWKLLRVAFFYALFFIIAMIIVVIALQDWSDGSQMLFIFGVPVILVWWMEKRRSRKVAAKDRAKKSSDSPVPQQPPAANENATGGSAVAQTNGFPKREPVSTTKGGPVIIDKPTLRKVSAELCWNSRKTEHVDLDLDVSAFLCGNDGMVQNNFDFVFYNNKTGGGGAVIHRGDSHAGDDNRNDECIQANLTSLPTSVKNLFFVVTINDADKEPREFGLVENAFIRILNSENSKELARYDLSGDYSKETSVIVCKFLSPNSRWRIEPIGARFDGGLAEIARKFGVEIEEKPKPTEQEQLGCGSRV